MSIKQLSIYLENKPGKLAEALRFIKEAGINIRALSLADTSEFGILRLITSDLEKAEELLSQKTVVKSTDVIAVKVDDRSGGLLEILEVLDQAEVNIDYMYAFTAKLKSAYAVLRVDDCALAEQYLHDSGIATLKGKDLMNLLNTED